MLGLSCRYSITIWLLVCWKEAALCQGVHLIIWIPEIWSSFFSQQNHNKIPLSSFLTLALSKSFFLYGSSWSYLLLAPLSGRILTKVFYLYLSLSLSTLTSEAEMNVLMVTNHFINHNFTISILRQYLLINHAKNTFFLKG